ncbi:MAG: prepilin-type N-terminal cleavage/methylation domain-containing protein [Candidatus Thiodiazotropha sp.]
MNRVLSNNSESAGFSLVEILVVVSILAATAFIATTVMTGVVEESEQRLGRVELTTLAQAVRRFRQDTGYFPREGRFDLDGAGATACSATHDLYAQTAGGHAVAGVNMDSLPAYAGGSCAERVRWFYSAANLWQLVAEPGELDSVSGDFTPAMPWNAQGGRGWRGPYLDDSAEGFVDIGDVANHNPVGDPVSGVLVSDVPAVLAGRSRAPAGIYLRTRRVAAQANTDLDTAGRPLLLFVEKDANGLGQRAVLVGFGANGMFDGYDGCAPDAAAGSDDEVICVYPN